MKNNFSICLNVTIMMNGFFPKMFSTVFPDIFQDNYFETMKCGGYEIYCYAVTNI